MMPEMDGFTFLKKLRADNRFCSIPFILLTARNTLQDKLQGLRVGVDAYMTKPFNTEELLLRANNLISNVRNRKEVLREDALEGLKSSKPKATEFPDGLIEKEDLEWLQQVEIIAEREIKNPYYSVDHLAQELLMSRRQVFRKIKKITGLTPKKYLNLIRLQKAKTILETGEVLTLTEICYSIGLENTTHFANLFEAEFGIRPHDLLKKSIL